MKVLPDEAFGLIHGKAGVITRTNGSRVCFIGSANESRTAWVSNYELVWLDESEEGVRWVQEEFDALWSSPQAVDLAEAVVQDVARLIQRVVVPDIDAWRKEEAQPAEPIVDLPIYRRENGLWAHQKSFIKRVIDAVPKRHPFEMKYDRIENVDWESCSRVLDSASQLEALRKGW